MPELHVIFGTGPLGKWTARELTKMGKQVRLINRSGKADGLPASAEIVRGDAYDLAQTRAHVAGAHAVYQCAQPAYHQWAEYFMPLQESILAGAIATGAKFIAAENLYMYGDTDGQPLTESTPYRAHTRKGKVRQAMTEALFAAHAAGKVRAAVARGSDFFGPEDHIYADLIFLPALAGKRLNVLGKTIMPHTFTYAPDFGKLLATLGTRDEALGQAWHVPSSEPVTIDTFSAAISEALGGKSVKTMAASALILRVMGMRVPAMREMVEMLYEWNKPFIMDSSKAQRAFGLKPTPLVQAIHETLHWCRALNAAPVA